MQDAETGDARRRIPRWALPAAGCALVATVATVLLIVRSAGAACASEIPAVEPVAAGPVVALAAGPVVAAGEARSGTATYYAANGGGNCSFDSAGPGMYVALSPGEYAAGAACGGYLDVTGPKGTVRVKITDQCPGCAVGHVDLSKEAFAKIGTLSDGSIAVTYHQVTDPTLASPLTMRIKDGASKYWLAVRVDNHGNPLASVEVKSGSGWVRLSHTDYNYWLKEDGAGSGPFSLRVIDTAGHTATVDGIALAPAKTQQTAVWLYGGHSDAPSSTPASPTSAAPSASQSVMAPAAEESSVPVASLPEPSISPSKHHRCG